MRQFIGNGANNEASQFGGKINVLSRLEEAHRSLETELASLTRRTHLTPEEEVRARAIKKKKLQTKDRIRVLMSRVIID